MEIRLNKFLAERLGLSRREADDAIAAGKVTVDGKVASLGMRTTLSNEVIFNGKKVEPEKAYTYLKFNKPVSYVCSRKKQGEADTIYSLLPKKYQALKTVGRLDKDSCGLILLTDDGDFAYQMTHPKFMKYKVYIVVLDRSLEPLHQQMIADFGVELPDGKSQLELTCIDGETYLGNTGSTQSSSTRSRKVWQVGMSEGRNRQIRRTFAALGYHVDFLKRIQFGDFLLGDLENGDYEEIKL